MKKKSIIILLSLLTLAFFTANAFAASTVTMTVGSDSGDTTETLVIPISVDDADTLSGAAFTIEYSTSLTVTVESSFFDTFYGQFAPLATTDTPDPDGGPEGHSVFDVLNGGVPTGEQISIPATVNSFDYYQPLLTNLETNGTNKLLISAARCTPAPGGTTTIFTLNVSLNNGEPAGVYPLHVIATSLNNTDAGYDGGGETIDLLIGSDLNEPVETAFTVLLDDADVATNVVDGQAEFVVVVTDTDGDGIPDSIEDAGCTSSTDADTDDDGIPDGVEDANQNGTVDVGETNPCLVDTDGDGIQDGTEWGYTTGHATDTDAGVFVPDADSGVTTTDPLDSDSDNDGFKDGTEDSNYNGQVDAGETDPLDCQNRTREALKVVEWNDKLVADFGTRGLYTFTEGDSDWQLLDNNGNVNHMLVWDGNLVVDFGSGRGMYYYNGTAWTWMTNLEAKLLIAWNNGIVEKVVADFGPSGGIYTYPSATNAWDWLTNWDGAMGMIVWNNNLVVDFGCDRGIYYCKPDSTWEWLTNWDGVSGMVIWNGNLVMDFGSGNGGIYYYNATSWEWLTNWDYVTDMTVWDGKLVMDFGSGNGGIYYHNGTGWTWVTNKDNTSNMLEWDDGSTVNLVIDFGVGDAIYKYAGGTDWTWLTGQDSVEMLEWGNYLAADLGPGNGIWYHDTTEWKPTNDWSTAD